MIVIQTIHIILAVVALVGLVGWAISYTEYSKRKKEQKSFQDQLKEQESRLLSDLAKSMEGSDRILHKTREDYAKIVEDYEQRMKSLADLREADIREAEELVRAKIEEIEKVYKEVLDDQNESLEVYEKYIKNFDAVISAVDSRLQVLDDKGIFAGDDEIGFFFSYVKSLQETLSRFKIEKDELDEQQQKEQEKSK